jgi:hypothetical protein
MGGKYAGLLSTCFLKLQGAETPQQREQVRRKTYEELLVAVKERGDAMLFFLFTLWESGPYREEFRPGEWEQWDGA